MALVVKVGEAKTRLSELLHRVEAGEEVILSRGPLHVARLAPVEQGRRAAVFVDLLEARDRSGARAVTAAELGLWRALATATVPTQARVPSSAPQQGAQDGPDAPPDAEEYRAPADAAGGFVADSSFVAAWLLPGPDRRAADAAAGAIANGPSKAALIVAPGFWSGLGDLLLAAHRRQRIDAAPAGAQLSRAGRLPITELTLQQGLDVETEGEARAEILRLAVAHALSFADAASLAFARARALPLAVNQPDLARAAARLDIPLLTDLSDADLR